jgi:hypothetical protein
MADSLSVLQGLPSDATNTQALAWVNRMRRILNRWRKFPGSRPMDPSARAEAQAALDSTEFLILINMGLPLPGGWCARKGTRALGLFLGRLWFLHGHRSPFRAIGRA